MRIVFMGSPEFAIPSLKVLLDNHFPVASVVTAPDKPQGRGQQLLPSPVKQFALQHRLNTLQPVSLNDPTFVSQLRSLQPDLCVVVAFRILPKEVFTIPRSGSLNLHASLLPKYRGAAPIQWAIINGERETGVTTFFLDENVDTGNIILQARVPIGPDETFGELRDRLAQIGAEIVLHTVRLIEMGKAVRRPQNSAEATPAPKILKDHCRIDWKQPAQKVHNLIRGVSPSPCAFTMHGEKLIKIYRTKIADTVTSAKPGVVLDGSKKLLVGTGAGILQILEIQQEGKQKLSAEEFLRGYRIHEGERFS